MSLINKDYQRVLPPFNGNLGTRLTLSSHTADFDRLSLATSCSCDGRTQSTTFYGVPENDLIIHDLPYLTLSHIVPRPAFPISIT